MNEKQRPTWDRLSLILEQRDFEVRFDTGIGEQSANIRDDPQNRSQPIRIMPSLTERRIDSISLLRAICPFLALCTSQTAARLFSQGLHTTETAMVGGLVNSLH